jgi:anti-sigma-K factor RskA
MAERPEDSVEELLPGYALNALTPDEAAMVERALEREPRYQSMLAEFLDGVAGLADGHEPRAVPPDLRNRVLAAIDADSEVSAKLPESRVMVPFRAPMPMAFWGVAAALVLAVVGVGATAAMEHQRVGDLEAEMESMAADAGRYEERLQQQAELAMLAVQPGVQQAALVAYEDPAPARESPDGMMVIEPDGKQMLWLMNLEQLPLGYTYQAWLWEGPESTYSVAVFMPDEDGQAMIDMWMPEHEDHADTWLTINVEPEGGSVTPSSDRVLWGRLN